MTTTARAVALLVCLLTLSGVHAEAQDPTGIATVEKSHALPSVGQLEV